MSNFFIHYWNNDTWEANRHSEGEVLDHAAGNLFLKRGVRSGDNVYVVTVKGGQLLLAGRIIVDRVVSQSEASRLLGTENLWEASDHILAAPGTGLPMRFDRVVPLEMAKQIRCLVGDKQEPLLFRSSTELDQQTLRGVRELSDDSARLLDSLIVDQVIPTRIEENEHNQQGGFIVDQVGDTKAKEEATQGDFHPDVFEDERQRSLANVVQRQGQSEFREALLRAYKGRCAISGCEVEATLQAAHILSYSGPKSNHCSNGLLLRADLHNLFDLNLLQIDPATLTVQLAQSVKCSSYGYLDGQPIALPDNPSERPNREALRLKNQR